jgi:Zn-dependent protease with chaperone function
MPVLSSSGSERKAPEEDSILQATREIGQHLGIPQSRFQRVLWIKHFRSDLCGFRGDTVFLSRSMIGKLEPEEWKPLLASYLIHKKTRRQGLLPTALIVAAEYLVLLFAGVVLIARVFGQNGALLALGYSLVMTPIFLTNRSTQDTKKRKLKADIEATKIIEREKFLQTLRKIDSFKLRDVERAKKSGLMSHFSTRPSITARISNLLAATDSASSTRG